MIIVIIIIIIVDCSSGVGKLYVLTRHGSLIYFLFIEDFEQSIEPA